MSSTLGRDTPWSGQRSRRRSARSDGRSWHFARQPGRVQVHLTGSCEIVEKGDLELPRSENSRRAIMRRAWRHTWNDHDNKVANRIFAFLLHGTDAGVAGVATPNRHLKGTPPEGRSSRRRASVPRRLPARTRYRIGTTTHHWARSSWTRPESWAEVPARSMSDFASCGAYDAH